MCFMILARFKVTSSHILSPRSVSDMAPLPADSSLATRERKTRQPRTASSVKIDDYRKLSM